MFKRFTACILLASIAQSTFGDELRENEAISGGGSSEADGLWVSGPSVYLRKDLPGLAVGMMKVPGKDRSYAYVVLIKGGESRKELAGLDSKSGVSGSTAHSKGFVEIANKKVAFEYSLRLDPKGTEPPKELLSVNGTDLEIGKGQVVLVDLSGEKVTWKQIRIALPLSPGRPTTTAQVETQSKELLNLLHSNREVRSFLK